MSPERGRSTGIVSPTTTTDNATKTNVKVNLNRSASKSTSNTNLRFLYSNATSLVNKFDEFKALIASLSMPHIILITETWFNTKSLVLLDGYNLFVKNRQAISHGGVVIYVREDILAMEELELQDEGEMVWCKIILPTEFLLVGCIYRPPHSHWEPNQAILKAITKACALANRRKNTGLIIAGDFNHPDIIWTNNRGAFGGKKGRNSSISMVDCLLELELNQLVKNPTFGSNVLDLVITNEESRIYQISHGPPISTSKKNRLHCTLTWVYELKSGTQKWTGRTRKNFTKGNNFRVVFRSKC